MINLAYKISYNTADSLLTAFTFCFVADFVSDAEKHRPQNVVVHAINETVSNISILILFSLYCHCTVAHFVLFLVVTICRCRAGLILAPLARVRLYSLQVIAFDVAA